MSRIPRDRLLLTVVTIAIVATACGTDDARSSPDENARAIVSAQAPTDPIVSATPDPIASASAPPVGGALTCPDRPPAEPLTAAELVNDWRYVNAVLYEDGRDYDAQVQGDLVIEANGRWDGTRITLTGDGSLPSPTAHGPGDWTFDGHTLNLMYDDGSDTDTYGAVRVGTHEDPNTGQAYRALTLEVGYEDGSCLIWLLVGAPATAEG